MKKQLIYVGCSLSVLIALGFVLSNPSLRDASTDVTSESEPLTISKSHSHKSDTNNSKKTSENNALSMQNEVTTDALNISNNKRAVHGGFEDAPESYTDGKARLSLQDRQYNNKDTYVSFVRANRDAQAALVSDDVVTNWQKQLPVYGKERVAELYPGIDLLFYEDMGRTDFDIQVAPGADLNMVQLNFGEGTIIKRGAENELLINYPDGNTTLVMNRPVSWQYIDGTKKRVQSSFDVEGNTVSFDVGNYDASRPLVID